MQLALANGVKHSKLYSRRVYDQPEVLVFLKDLGNKTNDIKTSVTVMEVWQSIATVEHCFSVKAATHNWSLANLGGQKGWRSKKHEIAEGLFPGRWPTPHHLFLSTTFYSQAQKLMHAADAKHPYDHSLKSEFASKSLWDELTIKVQRWADFSKMP